MARRLRIFISSPGDVGQERLLATRVVERLQGEFTGYLELEPILWEHEPLRASDHFQAQIIPPSECEIVICILWSRLGTRLPPQFQREDGSLYNSGTEWEFEDALKSFRERGTPDLMVYRKTAEPHASMSDEEALLARLQQKRALDAFIEKWFGSAKDTFRAAFHTFDTPDKFEAVVETHLRRLIKERLPKMVSESPGEAPTTIRWHMGSPFRGLQAFDVEHAPVFFGRTRAIAAIKDRLLRSAESGCAFVLVFGMSGCGKSSLVRAGVLPTITQPGIIDGIGLWRYAVARPTDSPDDLFRVLGHALTDEHGLPELAEVGFDEHEMAQLLRQAPERAIAAITSALKRAAETTAAKERLTSVPEARFCLVLDQLEEIFTLPSVDERQREGFANAVSALARSGKIWVIATMRADFYHRLSEVPAIAELKEGAGQYDVLPASFAEVGQMIRSPARAAGLSFDIRPTSGERLDDVLHEAAARDPEALPLLSFTLDQLFQARTEYGALTFAAYEKLGGLEGALSQRAEEVYSGLPETVKTAFPAVLRGLITVGENTVAARRVPLAGLVTTPARKELVDAFVAARLLSVDRADDGTTVVRVAHEALLRHWPRLVKFLDEDRVFFRTRDRVGLSATRWREEGRRHDFLLSSGKTLDDAVELLKSRRDDLETDLAEFITASHRHVERGKRARMMAIAGVTGAFFGTVSLFGGFSYLQWKRAEAQKAVAVEAIHKLTREIPARLAEVPGTRPVLRSLLQENLSLLDRLGGGGSEADRFDNFLQMGDIWLLLGDTAHAEEVFVKALPLAEATHKERNDTGTTLDLAAVKARLGDIAFQKGNPEEAKRLYEEGRTLLEGIDKKEQGVRVFSALSSLYDKLGDANTALGDGKAALALFQKDVALAEQAVKASDKTGRGAAELGLALARLKVGEAKGAGGDVEASLGEYEQALTLLKELAKTDPVAKRELGALYGRIGDAFFDSDPKGAMTAYESSLDLLKTVARKRPDITTQRYLADTYRKIADLRQNGGDLKGAIAAYENGLVIARDVAEGDEANIPAQETLAYIYDALSQARGMSGEVKEALADKEESLVVTLKVAKRQSGPDAERQQASILKDLGAIQLQRGNKSAALVSYQEGLVYRLNLVKGGAARRDREAVQAVADAYDRVAFVFLLLKRPQEALVAADEGLVTVPDSARLLLLKAHALLLSGKFDEAKALYITHKADRIDDRQRFDAAAKSDFAELRAQGVTTPDMAKIEEMLKT